MRLKNNSRYVKKIGFLLFSLILVLTSAFYFIKSDFFKVKEINIEADDLSCVQNSQIKSSLNFFGKNIFWGDFQKGEDDLKRKFFCIKNIGITKILPDKLTVKVSKRAGELVLIAYQLKESSISAVEQLIKTAATQSAEILQIEEEFSVDDEGVIFEKGGDNFIKVYVSIPDLSLGKIVDGELIKNMLKILKKINTLKLNTDESFVDKDTLIVNSYPKLVFTLNSDIDEKLAALQLILQNAKISDKEIEFIDLRFDKPIVRYGKR